MEKLLIVEDERWIAEGLKRQLDWNAMGFSDVLTAGNGADALALIARAAPCVAITDIRMPRMDGLEFAKRVHACEQDCAVVIISGYNQFDYAQKAIEYGVSQFLLKPVDTDELRRAVEAARETLANRRKLRQLTQSETTAASDARHWRDWFVNGAYAESACRFAVLAPADALPQGEQARIRAFLEGKCRDFFADAYQPDCRVAVFDRQEAARESEFAIGQTMRALFQRTGIRASVGLSDPCDDPRKRLKCYFQASRIALSIRGAQDGAIMTQSEFNRAARETHIPRDLLAELSEGIEAANRPLVETCARRLSAYLSALTSVAFHIAYPLAAIEILRVAQKNTGDAAALLIQCANLIGRGQSAGLERRAMCASLADFAVQALEAVQKDRLGESALPLERVMDYIDTHYDEDISLNGLAARCFVSPEHFSREFKRLSSENFSAYLRRVRLEKAAVLLSQTNLPIRAIAHKVGYDHENYFMRIFKQEHGETPSVFRKRRAKAT